MNKSENNVASYAIIGFGKSARPAKAFARKGIEVSVATTRDPEKFCIEAAAIGPEIIPATLADAVKADVIFLAVRFESHLDVARALPAGRGRPSWDVTNAYSVPPEQMEGLPSARFVAQAFTGAKLVKGFNHLGAAILEQDPAVHGGSRVVFLASDDESARQRSQRLRKNWVLHLSNWAGCRKADYWCRHMEIPGVN